MEQQTRDAIWDDLAALAFELIARPDDRDQVPTDVRPGADAENEEGER